MNEIKNLLLIPLVLLAGCVASGIMESEGGGNSSRFDPAQRLSPTAFEQNATMEDTSVHEDPNLLRSGVSRRQIASAFGAPNETSNQGAEQHQLRGKTDRHEIGDRADD